MKLLYPLFILPGLKHSIYFFVCLMVFLQTTKLKAQSLSDPVLLKSKVDEILDQENQEDQDATSHSIQSLSETTSSIVVFSRDEIQNMGIEDLYDLFNYVPGFQTTRKVNIGDSPLIQVRGQTADRQVLILVNGDQLNEVYSMQANLFHRTLATGNIHEIEVLTGTGVSMYGGSAFAAVVNIITNAEENEVYLGGGAPFRAKGQVNVSQVITDKFSVTAFANYMYDKGAKYTIQNENTRDSESAQNIYSQFRHDSWVLSLGYNRIQTEDFLNYGRVANNVNENTTTHTNINLLYEGEVHDKLLLKPSVSYNRYTWDMIGVAIPATQTGSSQNLITGPSLITYNSRLGFDLSYHPNTRNSFLTGISYQNGGVNKSGFYTNHIDPAASLISDDESAYIGELQKLDGVPPYDALLEKVETISLYAKYKLEVIKNISLFAGGRLDAYSDITTVVNPNLGVIYQSKSGTILKGSYGTAVRIASIEERFAQNLIRLGNEQIKNEKMESLEMSLKQSFGSGEISVTAFQNKISNLIIQEEDPTQNLMIFVNEPTSAITSGIETSLQTTLSKNVSLRVGHTYFIKGQNDLAHNNATSFILNFHSKKWNINVNGLLRPSLKHVLAKQNTYAIINAKCKYRLSHRFKINLSVLNLLNKEFLTYDQEAQPLSFTVPNRGIQWRWGVEIYLHK